MCHHIATLPSLTKGERHGPSDRQIRQPFHASPLDVLQLSAQAISAHTEITRMLIS